MPAGLVAGRGLRHSGISQASGTTQACAHQVAMVPRRPRVHCVTLLVLCPHGDGVVGMAAKTKMHPQAMYRAVSLAASFGLQLGHRHSSCCAYAGKVMTKHSAGAALLSVTCM